MLIGFYWMKAFSTNTLSFCVRPTVNKGSWIQAFRLKKFFIYGEIQNEIVTFPISWLTSSMIFYIKDTFCILLCLGSRSACQNRIPNSKPCYYIKYCLPGNLNSDGTDWAMTMWSPSRSMLTVGTLLLTGKSGSKKYLMSSTVMECIIWAKRQTSAPVGAGKCNFHSFRKL